MNNKVFQRTLHRELWQWLSENPEKSKSQWHRWECNGGDVKGSKPWCFPCSYNGMTLCKDCPLLWIENNDGDLCCLDGGLWDIWDKSKGNPQERTRLALLIKDLPVRDGVIYE